MSGSPVHTIKAALLNLSANVLGPRDHETRQALANTDHIIAHPTNANFTFSQTDIGYHHQYKIWGELGHNVMIQVLTTNRGQTYHLLVSDGRSTSTMISGHPAHARAKIVENLIAKRVTSSAQRLLSELPSVAKNLSSMNARLKAIISEKPPLSLVFNVSEPWCALPHQGLRFDRDTWSVGVGQFQIAASPQSLTVSAPTVRYSLTIRRRKILESVSGEQARKVYELVKSRHP